MTQRHSGQPGQPPVSLACLPQVLVFAPRQRTPPVLGACHQTVRQYLLGDSHESRRVEIVLHGFPLPVVGNWVRCCLGTFPSPAGSRCAGHVSQIGTVTLCPRGISAV